MVRWITAATAVVVAVLGWPAAAGASTRPPAIKLNISVGAPGAAVVVRGSGFSGGVHVDLAFDTPVVGAATTSGGGAFKMTLAVPSDATPMQHVVRATDSTGKSASAPFTVAVSWPMLGFDSGRTGANPFENALDPTRLDGLTATPLTDVPAASSPIVVGGKAFIGRSDGMVQAFDLATDTSLWTFATGGPVHSTPAFAQIGSTASLIVGSDDGNVYALDPVAGTVRWNFPTGGAVRSSPLIVQKRVFIGSDDGMLYALSIKSGKQAWKYAAGGPVESSPALAKIALTDTKPKPFIAIGSAAGLALVNAANGRRVWSGPAGAGPVIASPLIVPNGAVCGKVVEATTTGEVRAHDCATGDVKSSFDAGGAVVATPAVAPCDAAGGAACQMIVVATVGGDLGFFDETDFHHFMTLDGGGVYADPAVAGGLLWVHTSAAPGVEGALHAIDLSTREEVEQFPLPGDPVPSGPLELQSSPVIANGSILIATVHFALKSDWPMYQQRTGQNRRSPSEWQLAPSTVGQSTQKWSTHVAGAILSTPAVADGAVFFGTDAHAVYSFPESCVSCAPNWTGLTFGMVRSSPAVANGEVYVGSDDDRLYAFPEKCSSVCSPTWYADTAGPITSSPVVVNGVVYVGSEDHHLYAFPGACATPPTPCLPLWAGLAEDPIDSSPVVINGVAYIGAGSKLLAFDTSCQQSLCLPVWTGHLNDLTRDPVAYNGNIYIQTLFGHMYAFPQSCSDPCSPLWESTIDNIGGLEGANSPAAANGVVYAASGPSVYAYPASCANPCSPLWRGDVYADDAEGVAVANGVVYTTSTGGIPISIGSVEAFPTSCSTPCKPLWQQKLWADSFRSQPTVANGKVYAGTENGLMLGFGP